MQSKFALPSIAAGAKAVVVGRWRSGRLSAEEQAAAEMGQSQDFPAGPSVGPPLWLGVSGDGEYGWAIGAEDREGGSRE